MSKTPIALIFLSLSLSACSFSSHYKTVESEKNLPQTTAKSVKLYAEKPEQPFVNLGNVLAVQDFGYTPECVIDLLKEEAAKLGANSLVEVNIEYTMVDIIPKMQGSAIAVFVKGEENESK